MADNPQYVEWSDSLLIGHPEIDEEHKGIFAFAAALRDIDTTTAPRSTVSDIICRLVDYVSMHFGNEEELMREVRYPLISGHSIEHWKFFGHLTTIIDDYERGRENVLPKCLAFLTNWLMRHILVNDVQLAEFLRTKGS